jgi:glycosyltransferase involved in cell wall biosynthesis
LVINVEGSIGKVRVEGQIDSSKQESTVESKKFGVKHVNNDVNAAFYYLSDGYQTSGKSLMGRQSAGEGFLQGFAKHAAVNTLVCYTSDLVQFGQFKRTVIQAAEHEKPCSFIPFADYSRLSEVGCLFVPGPVISNDAWVRRTLNNRAYSICGVTHTTATATVMDTIGSWLLDPVQSWDAVVCTSTVVKSTVERVIEEYTDYLEQRIGKAPSLSVQLPVIPLGVDCAQFSPAKRSEFRAAWRDKLSIAEEDIVVLYVGRLNFTAKAHPLPMFLALEETARRKEKQIHLILAGWFDPPASEDVWKQAAARYCPSVKTIFLDGRQSEIRREIWSAADIFTSLSDNIQETFGLTPIEAMAAGLPVVVTDWDGYRDTVRHGVDGFRVPVWMPEPGAGEDLAVRFANRVDAYSRYCGNISQMTSIDIGACVAAYSKLIQNPELRQRMGAAGRQRACAEYDWSVVVGKYLGLWRELAQRRIRDVETVPRKQGKPAMPLRIDPFTLFQEYPTSQIANDSLIALQAGKARGWHENIAASVMNSFAAKLLLTRDEQAIILEYLMKSEEATVGDIVKLFPEEREAIVVRSIGWMSKNGFIGIRDSSHVSGR